MEETNIFKYNQWRKYCETNDPLYRFKNIILGYSQRHCYYLDDSWTYGLPPPPIRGAIFSFHMPFFIIANGYFIKHYDVKKIFRKSIKTLLYPYFVICMLSAVIYTILQSKNGMPLECFLWKIKAMIGGISKVSTRFYTFDSVWVVWFICTLFITRNLYVLIMNICREKKILAICIICGSAYTGYLLGKFYAFMPWSLDVALVSLIFIGIGDWLRQSNFLSKNYLYTLFLPFLTWLYIIGSTKSYIELATRDYPAGVFSILEAIAGSLVLITVSKLWEKYLPFSKAIAWFGKNSMYILGGHCIEMMYFNWNDWVFMYLPFHVTWIHIFLLKMVIITITAALIEFTKTRIYFNNWQKRGA